MKSNTIVYLNNRELLQEIHKSKVSFSSYAAPEYQDYDLIVSDISKINIRTIAEARRNRAARLSREMLESARSMYPDAAPKDHQVSPRKIPKQDLVFRVMTYSHIPLAPGRKKSPKITADHHEKVNFPPFQHWKFDDQDNLICVAKSHWKGDLETGRFCKTHGRMTERLGAMFIKLSERYGNRSNVRSYTYLDEMQGQAILQLSIIGLQFDESKSDNPFAYYTSTVTNSFLRIINNEKRNQNIRDDILEMNNLSPSWTRQNQNSFRDPEQQ